MNGKVKKKEKTEKLKSTNKTITLQDTQGRLLRDTKQRYGNDINSYQG